MDSLGSKGGAGGRISASTVAFEGGIEASTSAELYCPSCDRNYPSGDSCPDDGTSLIAIQTRRDPLLDRVLDGRFEIRELLGAGGMGSVYVAWQASVGREVAIKVIRPGASDSAAATKRFLREAKLASRLSQPNTVAVYDFGQTEDGLLYLVMERLVGVTLREALRQASPFSVARTLRVGIQLCDALDAAMQLHIVHRDLKPSNILVLDHPPGRDALKVLDFGLAKLVVGSDSHTTVTATGAVVGTPSYIPPEAICGELVDHRSDLYSLGVILYELLAGHPPFRAEMIHALYAMHLEEKPAPLPSSVPPRLASIVSSLLRKDPAHRIQTAAEVRDLLVSLRTEVDSGRSLGSGLPKQPAATATTTAAAAAAAAATTTAMPPTVTDAREVAVTPVRRGRGRMLAGGLALVLAVAAFGYWAATAADGDERSAPELSELAPVAVVASEDEKFDARPEAKAVAEKLPASTRAEATEARFRFESKPSAKVSIAGKVLGSTPFDYSLAISDAPLEVSFETDGYLLTRQTITPNKPGSVTLVSAELKVSPKRSKRSTRRRSSVRGSRRGASGSVKKETARGTGGKKPLGSAEDKPEIPFILP